VNLYFIEIRIYIVCVTLFLI